MTGKCETCSWRNSDECPGSSVPEDTYDRAWAEYYEEGTSSSDIARKMYALGHKAGRSVKSCGQWREKNPPHLLETLPGHTEWSRELHGYDILLECQRSATAISRGNKWFIPFCAAPQ